MISFIIGAAHGVTQYSIYAVVGTQASNVITVTVDKPVITSIDLYDYLASTVRRRRVG